MPQITVFTGFLGAGKTSVILSLLSKLPQDYKIVLLKNEFGDVKVDSELAKESSVQVTEMLNGCLCCVLVGQMKNALLEIQETQRPDRILIETSGSAFPAPIAWQIRELGDPFILDSIVTVIDCVNFKGYEDTSYTAKLQAKYTDLILMNKVELVTEREYDLVLDAVNELNTDTPKVKFSMDKGISSDVIFGLDTPLFHLSRKFQDQSSLSLDPSHHSREIDIIQVLDAKDSTPVAINEKALTGFLDSLPVEDVYRFKGIIRLQMEETPGSALYILNWAFGRFTLTPIKTWSDEKLFKKLSVMGIDLNLHLNKFKAFFSSSLVTLSSKDED